MSWIVLAAIEVGSLVGAGFASGREIWEFFARFGPEGQIGVLLFTVCLALAGGLILDVAQARKSESYRDLTTALAGPRLGWLLDLPVALSLYLGLAVTLAGAGELGLNLGLASPTVGIGLAALLTSAVLSRQNGLEAASVVLVPILVVFILAATGVPTRPLPHAVTASRLFAGGAISGAAQYFLYNALLGLVIFASLGRRASGRRAAWLGAMAGAAVLGALALAVVRAEVCLGDRLSRDALPLLTLAQARHSLLGHGYALALAAALLTTSVGNAFGLAARLERTGMAAGHAGVLISLAAVPVALVGFMPLVRYGYQIVALCGALYLGILGMGAVVTSQVDRFQRGWKRKASP